MGSKILCQINQEMPKASKNNRNSSKAFQLLCPELASICCGCFTGYFIYSFVIQVISEKHCVTKALLAI